MFLTLRISYVYIYVTIMHRLDFHINVFFLYLHVGSVSIVSC